ncbi:hypothetical protein [Priestia aryabhattai]
MDNQQSFKEIENYFKTLDKYYLGCQKELFQAERQAECHMFIIKSNTRHTGRGNIEFQENNTIHWFYTTNTNRENQKVIRDLKRTPKWFQTIYCKVMELKVKSDLTNGLKDTRQITPIAEVGLKKRKKSLKSSKPVKPKVSEEQVIVQLDLFSAI